MNEESVLETLQRKYVGKLLKLYYNTNFERTYANLSKNREKHCDNTVVNIACSDVVFKRIGHNTDFHYYLKFMYNNQKYLIQLKDD